MTNGRGHAAMASFMTKKKKYKFQVEICLEELLEVPFVSAVLFAKLRLLDGGNFQDHSSRQEVRDHKVQWNAKFTFPCKMMANASTGVMERCVLRISIRKESKGGRSFNKLGFVDLNLAEYAGAGLIHKKALLEGYDARHRQDNSMLKFKIELNMISGDILFKVPSPSLKHKQVNVEDGNNEQRSDEFSSGSLAGSIASGSSGFGSLPKKRPALLSSELVIGQTLTENNVPVTLATDYSDPPLVPQPVATNHVVFPSTEHIVEPVDAQCGCEPGHSRNSSNTSQLSKASGYSSIHSHTHSRQSSSGDSGHIRDLPSRSLRMSNAKAYYKSGSSPKKINIPNTILSTNESFTRDPELFASSTPVKFNRSESELSRYYTPKGCQSQTSQDDSVDSYKTPETSSIDVKTDIFSQNFNELQKSSSTSVVEKIRNNLLTVNEVVNRKSDGDRLSPEEIEKNRKNNNTVVLRSRSEFEIPRMMPAVVSSDRFFPSKLFSSDSLFSFLTPRPKRKNATGVDDRDRDDSPSPTDPFKIPQSSLVKLKSLPETRATSLSSLSGNCADGRQRGLPHRKLLEGTAGGKLAPLAISPDEQPTITVTTTTVSSDSQIPTSVRCPGLTTNPSAGSLVLSETGSLDRAKAAYERRKKIQLQESDAGTVPGRVEITRVNPDDLIEELLKNTNLEQPDDSAETSGLQLFIAKDGTAAVGNHEVKSQMSTGVQVFKQVVMDDR